MNSLPKISEAELEVMKVLWTAKSSLTANEVIQCLEETNDWSPKTVRTLLNRLVKKRAISSNQEKGKLYTYTPLIFQDNYLQIETKSFLKRFYGAALKPLLVNFIKEEKLSLEEINELREILDDKAKPHRIRNK
ncbi:TPA: BlaI/MecI/CopY family transcriptional regulator [Bacillus cereus]|uniref:BlaI/MecI/CopY family transcriptional regulator n=1 Tax=Bacillus cereus TaxID=1396 RepID=UPI0001A0E1FB|nr:BlaI/MecI/CopY family transcriptional regulator [Bacillus cereus]EEL61338.1 Beta-lactamase repressor [Bacillus cereus F65185]PFI66895.1 BlaI/MecI/CopY family transcriptional regulator [Bacillus cereus]PFJ58648.1 BlaI/MecI/CopY family transcriptional regulator [Bacillus cereus]PFN29430.1 BlaI/MecI/CopY family transcriptional regulator [Bacillus cereus]HDX9684181.1 BlaI/MecI/CopY family transcriptional regulator [Bacillus cereus]